MAKTISITASDGTTVQFVDEVIGSGAMKDVYFSPDKKYVVGFFRNKQDVQSKDRLKNANVSIVLTFGMTIVCIFKF